MEPLTHAQTRTTDAAAARPTTLIIACCDAQLDPARLAGAAPGSCLELRTFGNVVPPYRPHRVTAEAATIAYATEILGVQEIVVVGHSGCGAVAALQPGGLSLRAFDAWWWLTRSGNTGRGRAATDDPGRAHLRLQVAKLLRYPKIKRRLTERRLDLRAYYADPASGTAELLEPPSRT
ncbi:carbonic anhydrase [Actinocorallia herbida]|uniref:carbonic anhydrase n=1 Tax=Actinocorallia herbida TaxID=58109 RepID=A0A3N1CXV0_9ACTN|nr:carbonic anhydrase [Actinocorallia herbida]ROO86117.1 carbonic anhydrase [Actinocorallia herbida]